MKVTEIRCSKLARPMVCAGILHMKDLHEEETNEAAKEGTAYGEYIQYALEGRPVGAQATNGVYFDNDMKFHAADVLSDIAGRAGSQVLCEQKIDWQTRSGIWIRGSLDMAYIDRNGDLCIDDNKYGFRVVEVRENWQLLGYAIGEVIRRQMTFQKIHLRILQPRAHHEDGDKRTWTLTLEELLGWKERIEERMAQLAAGESMLVTGAHCRYCPAAAEACPALNKAFYASVDIAHEFVQDSISNAELSKQLMLIKNIKQILDIKERSVEQLAINRINAGEIVPGYVLEESYGNREWKPWVTPDAIKAMTGIDVIEKTMLSPSKAEKMGVPKDVVKEMVDRFFKGKKVVRKDHNTVGEKLFGKVEGTNG